MCIPGENVYSVPHRECGCDAPGMAILTGNEDVPHQACTSSLQMHIVTVGEQ